MVAVVGLKIEEVETLHAYLLAEGPFEQRVVLAPHDDKEERKVRSSTRPVTVQIQPQAHFVAIFAGVERCEEEKQEPTIRLTALREFKSN